MKKKNQFSEDFERRILSSGTISDRVALLCQKVHDDPIKNCNHLETLVGMVSPRSKREALLVIDLLKELFINDIIPKGNLLNPSHEKTKQKVPWHIETKLQEHYSTFIDNLSNLLKDSIAATKYKALMIIHELILARSIHRERLIQIAVNKLGDPEKKVASSALYRLRLLARTLPDLRKQLVEEVERFLHRSNLLQRALYYGLCFLNQLVLSSKQTQLAFNLVRIYCAFFRGQTKADSKGNSSSTSKRLLAALLTGLHRAVPFTDTKNDPSGQLREHVDSLFRMVHTLPFNISIQALLILHQLAEKDDNLHDRFYSSLYRKLGTSELVNVNKKALVLHLVLKSMRKDPVERRVRAMLKRLLQGCLLQEAGYVCGVLLVLDKLSKERPQIIQDAIRQVALPDSESEDEEEEKTKRPSTYKYDSNARNPLYAGAEHSLLWEMLPLMKHYHPSVRLFAEKLLKGEPLDYSGNPLLDFKLKKFLDRLSYKNPKKVSQDSGAVNHRFRSRDDPGSGARGLALSSTEYAELTEDLIPEDEKFMYRHLRTVHEKKGRQEKKKKKSKDDESDEETGSIADDEFDDFLDNYESKEGVDFSTGLDAGAVEDDDDDDDDDAFMADDESGEELDEEEDDDEEDDEDEDAPPAKKKKKNILDEFVDAEDFDDGSLDSEDEDEGEAPVPSKKLKIDLEGLQGDSEAFGDLLDMGTAKSQKRSKQMAWDLKRSDAGTDWRRRGRGGRGKFRR